MRETTVLFDRVMDCPHWSDGECMHVDGPNYCEWDELATPSNNCPCKEVK